MTKSWPENYEIIKMDKGQQSYQYRFGSASAPHTASYLTEYIINTCKELGAKKILDIGCGNGSLCSALAAAGFSVTGCDPSEDGISIARQTYPHIPFYLIGVYDDPNVFQDNKFDLIVSTEVIEHLYLPRCLLRFASCLLKNEGHLIITTPYHGYLKNIILALSGKMDAHFTALWDGGHIKFWSKKTLTILLNEEGFSVIKFKGAGRLPYLWKSMILVAKKRHTEFNHPR